MNTAGYTTTTSSMHAPHDKIGTKGKPYQKSKAFSYRAVVDLLRLRDAARPHLPRRWVCVARGCGCTCGHVCMLQVLCQWEATGERACALPSNGRRRRSWPRRRWSQAQPACSGRRAWPREAGRRAVCGRRRPVQPSRRRDAEGRWRHRCAPGRVTCPHGPPCSRPGGGVFARRGPASPALRPPRAAAARPKGGPRGRRSAAESSRRGRRGRCRRQPRSACAAGWVPRRPRSCRSGKLPRRSPPLCRAGPVTSRWRDIWRRDYFAQLLNPPPPSTLLPTPLHSLRDLCVL